jgi:hypothetical protein
MPTNLFDDGVPVSSLKRPPSHFLKVSKIFFRGDFFILFFKAA